MPLFPPQHLPWVQDPCWDGDSSCSLLSWAWPSPGLGFIVFWGLFCNEFPQADGSWVLRQGPILPPPLAAWEEVEHLTLQLSREQKEGEKIYFYFCEFVGECGQRGYWRSKYSVKRRFNEFPFPTRCVSHTPFLCEEKLQILPKRVSFA